MAAPGPRKLTPADFAYGILLGEGAYGRVVHARRSYPNGKLGNTDFAVKMIEKRVVSREKKVRRHRRPPAPYLSFLKHPLTHPFHSSPTA